MGTSARRFALWLDRLEELMRLAGEELEAERDALAGDLGVADTDRTRVERELARRSLAIPFFRDVVAGAAGRNLSEIAESRGAAALDPWPEGQDTVSRPSASRRGDTPAPGPAAAASDHGDPPKRLRTAERVLAGRTRALTVVLDNFQNPLNASAVVRTCEAFGLQELHFCHRRGRMALAPGIHKRCHRWLDLHWHRTEERTLAALRAGGYRVYAADVTSDSVPLEELPLSPRTALVFGNEQAGVSDGFRNGVDGCFHLPTTGFTAYINVSNAVAMSVASLDRRLREAKLRAPLPDSEKRELRRAWYETLARGNDERRRTYAAYLEDPPEPLPDEASRSRRHGER